MPILRHTLSALVLAMSFQAQAVEPTVEQRLAKLEQQQADGKTALPANVTVTGLVEVEGSVTEELNATSGEIRSRSDLVVATVEVGVAAEISDRVSGEVVFLYEQDATDFGVDVATLTIAELVGPVNFTVGKMVVPFGRYETALINDTLLLELGETNNTSALFGFEQSGVKAGAYVFDGEEEREKHVENYGVTVGFEQDRFAVGADYLSSLSESDGVVDLNDSISEEQVIDPVFGWDDAAPAYTVFGKLDLGAVALIAEYLDVTDPLVNEVNLIEIEPSAAQVEADLTAGLAGREYTFAIAYQQTEEAVLLGLPEERISCGVSTEIYRNVTLAGEFWQDADYSVADGGTGEEFNNVVLQLGAAF